LNRTRAHLAAGALVALVAALFFACASGPIVVPDGLAPGVLAQRALEASDDGDYATALAYYQAMLDRYSVGNENKPYVAQALYEIGFIKYKQKAYTEAKAYFERLLDLYKGSDAKLYPAKYKVLGEKILAKVDGFLGVSASPSSSADPSPDSAPLLQGGTQQQ
jgi:outer membrane protein assembly factor BamD (BamD/ComL family)